MAEESKDEVSLSITRPGGFGVPRFTEHQEENVSFPLPFYLIEDLQGRAAVDALTKNFATRKPLHGGTLFISSTKPGVLYTVVYKGDFPNNVYASIQYAIGADSVPTVLKLAKRIPASVPVSPYDNYDYDNDDEDEDSYDLFLSVMSLDDSNISRELFEHLKRRVPKVLDTIIAFREPHQ